MGDQPLNHNPGIKNIMDWAQNNNVNTLWDISSWEEDNVNTWKAWQIDNLPNWLSEEKDSLIHLLKGKAPAAKNMPDKRGWGQRSGKYSASEGYKALLSLPHVAPNPARWNFIWNFPLMPKIDFFCWTAAHQSILTGDNLKIRGMEGPSRCPLCCSEEETMDHLLLNCPFSKEVWSEVLLLNLDDLDVPHNIPDLFAS